jgi:tRNA modification GTPase
VAGTTRDALAVTIALPRGQVRIIDVAGLEKIEGGGVAKLRGSGVTPSLVDRAPNAAGGFAKHAVKEQMRERALRTVAEADFVVLVQPSDEAAGSAGGADGGDIELDLPRHPDLIVASKSDLRPQPESKLHLETVMRTSIITGEGIAGLRLAIDALAFGRSGSESRLALNLRHVRAIEQAIEALQRAAAQAGGAVELCAAELREALDALGQVLGQVSPDDLIGRIFSQFCIGK